MTWLLASGAPSASLARRGVLFGGVGLALAACSRTPALTVSHTPVLDMTALNRDVAALAARAAPGVLGVGLMNLESGEHFTFRGDRPFPMQSVAKLPLAAAVLAEADGRRLSLSEVLAVTDQTLSPPWSPIADAWPARRAYSVDELLNAAVGESDNTAADLLMKRIGGPGAVTAWLQIQRIMEIRVDRYERELQPQRLGMASFRAAWRGAAAFESAKAAVPAAQRRVATQTYLADPRDTATPRSMLDLLGKLDAGELISARSTGKLLGVMLAASHGTDRLKAGLPKDATFAHKSGSSGADLGVTAAFNDVGVFRLNDRRSYAVAAFLSGSTASDLDQADLFADLGQVVARHVG